MLSPKQKRILTLLKEFEENAVSRSDEEIMRELCNMDSCYGHEATYSHNVDGVLINIGIAKQSLCLINHASKRLNKILQDTKEEFPLYYMGNALVALSGIKYGNNIEELIGIKELRTAREYFSSVPPGRSFSQAYTNLANILERYGRNYEAIQIYDKVIEKQPDFGMALGNKAKALLYYYSQDPSKNPGLIYQARELLIRAIGEPSTIEFGGQRSLNSFKGELESVKNFILQNNIRKPYPKDPLDSLSRYQRFCMEKNIFLNYCFNCFRCRRGFTDNFAIYFADKFSKGSEESNHRYSGYSKSIYYSIKTLNQIYEDYATARYIYFLANTKKLAIYDKSTEYIYALDYCRNSLQYGLVKTAYIKLFNILDKIARLVYTIYGLEDGDTYFWNLKSARYEQLLVEKRSLPLLALHSMAWDFKTEQIYSHLSLVRNHLTHEFIDIGLIGEKNEDDRYFREHHLSEKLLCAYTEDLFQIVKSALVYFMSALYRDYRVRKRDSAFPLTLQLYKQKRFF